MLHHRDSDSENIGFLEGIFTKHPGHLLSANHKHWNRVHLSGHKTGHGISRTGPGSN